MTSISHKRGLPGPLQTMLYNWSTTTTTLGSSGPDIVLDGDLDAGGAGVTLYKQAAAPKPVNGTNGPRGDSIASDAACDAGATFFFAHYVNMTGTDAMSVKGSTSCYAAYIELASNASYGEAAGFVTVVTNNRDGGLAEGFEATVIDNTGGGRNVGISLIAKANAAITRWFRGIWLTSQGTQAAGDAIYIDGTSGWANFLRLKNTAGSDVLTINGAGALNSTQDINTLGVNNSTFTRTNVVFQPGTGDLVYFGWSPVPNPNGDPRTVASPGSFLVSPFGGAGTTLWVKESGVATNTGWVAK